MPFNCLTRIIVRPDRTKYLVSPLFWDAPPVIQTNFIKAISKKYIVFSIVKLSYPSTEEENT